MKKSTLKASKNIYIPTIKEANKHLETENYTHLDEFVATFDTGTKMFREELQNVLEDVFLEGAKVEAIPFENEIIRVWDDLFYLVRWKHNSTSPYQVLSGADVRSSAQFLMGWTQIPESLSELK